MGPKTANSQWWSFSPIIGLDVTNRLPDFDRPMFGDATIISRHHIQDLISLVKIGEKAAEALSTTFNRESIRGRFSALIAVRRTGWFDPEDDDSKLLIDSNVRISEVAAALNLVLILHGPYLRSCGLLSQVADQTDHHLTLSFSQGFYSGMRARLTLGMVGRAAQTQLSRAELIKVTKNTSIRALTKILLSQTVDVHSSFRASVSQASRRISDSIHSSNYSDSLLGAVTSIEILLAEHGDSFGLLDNRIAALIGDKAVIDYGVAKILRARHNYVHKGIEILNHQLVFNAIGLATSCLLRFAELADKFPHRTAAHDYLDLISQADRVRGNTQGKAVTSLERLLMHTREGHTFRFVQPGAP